MNEFSQKILQAASKIDQLDLMKKGNRQLAEKRADWQKNFPVLLEAYQLALERKASHA